MDWNFIAIPRSRPNKWWVEIPINPEKDHGVCNNEVQQQWKEWAYATDQYSQHYYCEHWQRWDSIVTTCEPPVLCLRKEVWCLHRSIGIVVVASRSGGGVGTRLRRIDTAVAIVGTVLCDIGSP
jgi:hypothetical protein